LTIKKGKKKNTKYDFKSSLPNHQFSTYKYKEYIIFTIGGGSYFLFSPYNNELSSKKNNFLINELMNQFNLLVEKDVLGNLQSNN